MDSRLVLGLVLALAIAVAPFVASAATTTYQTLASFDFLSSDEVSNFENMTLAGGVWNTTLTSYTVSGGKLNISNTDTSDALLIYPRTLNGYAEITLDQGAIGVFTNYNGTSTILTGYEIVKDSSGITVYEVNGTSKTAVASLTTTANTIIVTVMNGKFRVDLPDGTGIYEAPLDEAVLALGAPASDGSNPTYGVFDKVVLYGTYLSGQYEVDLGTKTVYAGDRVAEFSYDVSAYKDIQSAKLVVTMSTDSDPYLRYFIISTSDPGQNFWNPWPSSYLEKGTVAGGLTATVDVTNIIKSSPTGTFYVGISTFDSTGWKVSAKLVLDASAPSTSTDNTVETTTSKSLKEYFTGDNAKYLALGVGVIVLIALVAALAGGGRRRGITPLVTAVIILLVLGGIAAAVMAYFHPEYLTALAYGLGAIAILAIFILYAAPRKIPNPTKQ